MAQAGTIELKCPGCEVLLELDSGFAGGVCRCYSCGMLMTVPAEPHKGKAQRLTRPDRPDSPGRPVAPKPAPSPAAPSAVRPTSGRPASPTQTNVPSAVRPPTPRPDRPGGPATIASSSVPSPGVETFVTASGQRITVKATAIATTRKRHRPFVRATTMAVFGLIMLIVLGAGLTALYVLTRDDRSSGPGLIGISASANPYTSAQPSVLGIPLAGNTTLVLDASAISRDWWPMAVESVNTALARTSPDIQVQVMIATDLGVKSVLPGLTAVDGDVRSRIAKACRDAVLLREADLVKAIHSASLSGAERITLVTGQPVNDERSEAIKQKIGDAPGSVALDVVVIGPLVKPLRNLAEATGGRYVGLPLDQLKKWHAQAGFVK